MEPQKDVTYQYLPLRGLTVETLTKYGITHQIAADGKPIAVGFPYAGGATKVRKIGEDGSLLKNGGIYVTGEISKAGLFGKDKFPPGSSRSITVTEGELDAPSIFQAVGYPAVSIQSAGTARRDCTLDRDYLNSFERIYLALDSDDPGQRATREIASLFDFNKVYHVKLGELKDANAYVSRGESDTLKRVWYNSKRFLPDGVVSTFDEIDAIIDEKKESYSVPYPYPSLQEMTEGLRTKEFVLVTAMEGVGKTEFIRRIESQLIMETDAKIGIIHIEEGKDRVIKGLVGHYLKAPVHIQNPGVSDDEIKAAYRAMVRHDERVHIYGHFGSDDPDSLVDIIRFLVAACGCKYIFLDHITMAVTGINVDDERKTLDYLSTKLASMCHELDFSLVLVSHVNDDGLTRGSRNISKVADVWVHLDRDITSESDFQRRIITPVIRKNRPIGRTGPCANLIFMPDTFMLHEMNKDVPVE